MARVVFLDRDGVINSYPGDFEYVKSWEEFHFLPGVKPALKKLSDKDFRIFIVSNQAGVSKGVYAQQELERISANMLKEFRAWQIKISGVYYCIHRQEDNCPCRKPKTGLIDKAALKLKKENARIDPATSYLVGDTLRDIATGRAAGLKTILVFSGKEKPENKATWESLPDFTAANLSEAVEIILNS